ncbi:glycosyl hydrolase family 18 protein [Corallococcus carmarthensis]|uniref:glycosyl hydrolase family 18 protein n=1 Tax=Corallococcus carmarthensis TaxID=2316728 RepID=UPI00148C1591|nr:glycosyl hydrolase family 18 protein [Corallococcus carmarthensis]NOK23354.1 chitinase [Corallococcus carmarthensis]
MMDPKRGWAGMRRVEPKQDGPETFVPDALALDDVSTRRAYRTVGYRGDGLGNNLSYTPVRVGRPVYNTYPRAPGAPRLSAYVSDLGLEDGRPLGLEEPRFFGRGFDVSRLPPTAYDRLIFGSLGIVGDAGPRAAQIRKHARGAQLDRRGRVTIVDYLQDVASFPFQGVSMAKVGASLTNYHALYFSQERALGMLGGLRNLQQQAAAQGHALELAFCVGGWLMSGHFSGMAASPRERAEFVSSIVEMFALFPMFSSVDLDWDCLGGGWLASDESSKDDSANYVRLVAELRAALDGAARSLGRKEISVAASCDLAKLRLVNVPVLRDVGLDRVYLKGFDFFSPGTSRAVVHHANLKRYPGSPHSIELAVESLLSRKVDPGCLHLGYAAEGQAAAGASRDSLQYNLEGAALGTFEAGVVELYDLLRNQVDFSARPPVGRNGFDLCTDRWADADYLYSEEARQLITLDTPRTVKAKAEFAAAHGLGGVFCGAAHQDTGLLHNAAREGLGAQALRTVFDMASTYVPGQVRPLGPGVRDMRGMGEGLGSVPSH